MAAELLGRSRILVVCGDFIDDQVKDDIALAKRLRIPATTLDGIMEVEGSTGKRMGYAAVCFQTTLFAINTPVFVE